MSPYLLPPTVLSLVLLLLSCLATSSYSALCNTVTEPDITCPEDVVNAFTSIHLIKGVLDVVFIIDEGALTAPQHYWTKQFIQAFSRLFVISPDYTRVSMVTFTSSATVAIPLSSNADMCSFPTSVHNVTLRPGSSYLSTGLDAAINELKNGRPLATKLAVLVTNGGWGNLGADPQLSANTLKSLGYMAAVILKHPNQNIGLVKDVIFDNFASFFGSKKLGFTVNMTPEYLRSFHSFLKYAKAVGSRWSLDMEVDGTKCTSVGRSCLADQFCVCEVRSLHSEYICVGKDQDPPEAIYCEGPKSPIVITDGSASTQVTWTQPRFSDNTGIVQTVSDKLPGQYHVGSHTVVTTATDKNGNTATCSFSFTVTT